MPAAGARHGSGPPHGRLLHNLRQYSRRHSGLSLAGLPLTLNLAERGWTICASRKTTLCRRCGDLHMGIAPPDDARPAANAAAVSVCRVALGGCIWWVTRRLYGNFGGYTALALYCLLPVLRACVAPNPEMLAALGVYGGVYTCIGVAHAMQGPRRKWRPRMVLLTSALPWWRLRTSLHCRWWRCWARTDAVGGRRTTEPGAAGGAGGDRRSAGAAFCLLRILPDAFSYVFRSAAGLGFSLDPARRFFGTLGNAGITVAAGAALLLYLGLPSSLLRQHRPATCALVLLV